MFRGRAFRRPMTLLIPGRLWFRGAVDSAHCLFRHLFRHGKTKTLIQRGIERIDIIEIFAAIFF